MRLKRLEVFGFKSFFDKTVITFKKGITGIVGPNGCGKSNFSDAILWVLGEQSPKSLRGERMEDVIFNGTEQRKPLSIAEVTLTIGDIANELPAPYTPYSEITFSRRLYRSGESEYLINKSPCRLKDIRDLLIDMGAGYHAHTIIEQGKVDDLITASPLKRRELVEEAAGIAKYRLRKAEALRKLEATERNLIRVSDIIGEIKRQRNALDRQAKKAEKSKETAEALKALELQIARHEWIEVASEEKALKQEENQLQENSAELSAQLGSLGSKQNEYKLALIEKEADLTKLSRQISEIEKTIQRWEGKVETIQAQRQEWHENQLRTEQDIHAVQLEFQTLEAEAATLEKELASFAQTLPSEEAEREDAESQRTELETAVLSGNTTLERDKVALFDLTAKLTTSKNNVIHFENRKEILFRQKERLQIEQSTLQEKQETAEKSLQTLVNALHQNEAGLAQSRATLQEKTQLLNQTETTIQTKEKQLFQMKERLSDLKAQIASHEGFYRGFLNEREGSKNQLLQLDGLQGMVADLIDVPPQYEQALEAALENRLRGIVVENHDEIQKGIQHLKASEMGRGTFFPRYPRTGPSPYKSLGIDENQGILGMALDRVTIKDGFESIAEALLQGIVLTSNLKVALNAWARHPDVFLWVTLQGEVLDQYGVISAGGQGKQGLLGQKRALQLLTQEADTLQKEAEALQKDIETQQDIARQTRLALNALNEEIRTLDVTLAKSHNEKKTLSYELERLQGELETILFEQEEGNSEEEQLTESLQSEQRLITETERLKSEKESALRNQKEYLDAEKQRLESLNETVVQLRMKTSTLKAQQQHALEKQARIQRERENLSTRLNEMEALKATLQDKLNAGKIEEKDASASIETLASELSLHTETLRKIQEEHAELLSILNDADQDIASVQSKLNSVQEALQKNALKKVSTGMNREKIEEEISTRYHIDISEDFDFKEALPLEAAQAKAETLRQQLETLGPVNLAAIEEYKELDTRFQFLKEQEDDLMQSIESLHQAINKINKTTRGLFVDTFHTLNEKFKTVYTSFFGGGSAELVLIDEARPLESGIEMFAQPPGKGKRNILLLSGGEKALTAISLLFATFLIHPTPFCLLDEIDAPLDEENTRRFAQTLEKMSDNTQFIVVTHNKLTMETADVLYGVTMEETGISKLVSVNLNHETPADKTADTTATLS